MNDFLMHYGIKGMRWGVRRNPDQLGHHKVKSSTINVRGDYDVERNSYRASQDKRLSKAITKSVLKNPEKYKGLIQTAKRLSDVSHNRNVAYNKYSEKLKKERGKAWDGDGTEEHYALEKRYPEYKALSDKETKVKKKYIDKVYSSVKSGNFDHIKKMKKYPENKINYNTGWYQKGDPKVYAVADNILKMQKYGNESDSIYPQMFIRSYQKNKRIKGPYDL